MPRSFLHVGCGPQTQRGLKGFDSEEWHEVRFDIDRSVNPDIVGTLTDMSQVADASVDAIYSSHNIEHLFAHEVRPALREFRRVLKEDGFVVLTCPDLQSVCEAVAQGKLTEPLYASPSGPVTAHDVLFGYGKVIADGNVYMAHKCGFTYPVLHSCFVSAGFAYLFGGRRPPWFDLWLVGFKTLRGGTSEMDDIARSFLP
jgi:SAM-dependent methyltransferase